VSSVRYSRLEVIINNLSLYSLMKLAYWMYAGPAHIGTLRVASSFKNVHAIMHAPLGDDYFNVMRSMLERERDFTPVTTSVVDRHVLSRGSQEKVSNLITRKDKEEQPDLILLTPTCTSSLLQEDLANFVKRASEETSADVLLADVNHYRINELQAADRTLEQIVRFIMEKEIKNGSGWPEKTVRPSVNIIGPFTLGFHNNHDCRELKRLFDDLNIEINQMIPEGASVYDLKDLRKAWVNIVPYREVGIMTAQYLYDQFAMPYVDVIPMGVSETEKFIRQLTKAFTEVYGSDRLLKQTQAFQREKELEFEAYIAQQKQYLSQSSWFARSIDCQNLTGKKVVVFGDATHAAGMTKVLSREMGIEVVCAGTYCKHDADWFRDQVQGFANQVLITDDHTQVGEVIAELAPAAIFGTQMERHVGKRLGIPCGVISAPVHIQNYPLAFKPFLGYEGSNQIADLVYNSFSLGMEDHLLEIFGGHDTKAITPTEGPGIRWNEEASNELSKIPGFVRGKVKANTEKFALSRELSEITLEVLLAAKEALST